MEMRDIYIMITSEVADDTDDDDEDEDPDDDDNDDMLPGSE